jgi:hypothetical protein
MPTYKWEYNYADKGPQRYAEGGSRHDAVDRTGVRTARKATTYAIPMTDPKKNRDMNAVQRHGEDQAAHETSQQPMMAERRYLSLLHKALMFAAFMGFIEALLY